MTPPLPPLTATEAEVPVAKIITIVRDRAAGIAFRRTGGDLALVTDTLVLDCTADAVADVAGWWAENTGRDTVECVELITRWLVG